MASVTFADSDAVLTDLTTYDFTSSIGANSGPDSLYLFVAGRSISGVSAITSVTVDGIAAALVVQKSEASGTITTVGAIYAIARNSLPNPGKTSVTVTATFNGGCIRAVCDAYLSPNADLTAFSTATASDPAAFGSTTLTLDINAPAGGIVVGGSYNGDNGSYTWTGLGADHDTSITAEGPNQWSSASASNVSAATPRSISVAIAANISQPVVVIASFSPAASQASATLIGV